MHERTFRSFDGTSIYYRIVGRGVPIVLCDGIGCDQYVWKHIVDYFWDEYTVIRWNYRGHGKSGQPVDPDAIRVSDHAQDLRALLNHLEISKAVLIGHSMGVQVVLETYGQQPDLAAALVLVCGSYQHPLNTFHGDSQFKEIVFPHLYRILTEDTGRISELCRKYLPTEFVYRLASLTELNRRLINREDFWPYLEHMATMDLGLFARMLKFADEHTAENVLETIAVPTLIFSGERDRFTPASLSEEMHHRIRGSELSVLPQGSHTAPLEHPDQVNLRLEKFLNRHIPTIFTPPGRPNAPTTASR